jgi:hypothetical protein
MERAFYAAALGIRPENESLAGGPQEGDLAVQPVESVTFRPGIPHTATVDLVPVHVGTSPASRASSQGSGCHKLREASLPEHSPGRTVFVFFSTSYLRACPRGTGNPRGDVKR